MLQKQPNPSARAAAAAKEEGFHKEAVYIKKSVLNEIINHCMQELPYEACGLLSGKRGKNETLWRMKNVERSPTSFGMDLKQISQTFDLMKKQGEELTGIYHSHPTGAPFPSRDDILNAHYPEAAYYIVSLASGKPVVRCYRIRNKQVVPLAIVILD